MDTDMPEKASTSIKKKKKNKLKLDAVTQISSEEYRMWLNDKEYIEVEICCLATAHCAARWH